MSRRQRRGPLAQFEHGTRIYSPTTAEPRYRVISRDPATNQRVSAKCRTEEEARQRARTFEQFIAQAVPIRDPRDRSARTVSFLAERYVQDHLAGLSLNYREKQVYNLDRWVLPRLGSLRVLDWTPADSAAVLAKAREHGASASSIQDIGSAMRALVTHARRMRWLTSLSEDPMWMVKYSKGSTIQGAHAVYVPRGSLPTDEQCAAIFTALEGGGAPTWALAMRLKHRSGLRWGELIALQADDIVFSPRVVHVRRAVEQGKRGAPTIKLPKNGRVRTSIFPESLVDPLERHVRDVRERDGGGGLLFPGPRGGLVRRANFQPIWAKAADAAGWQMVRPLQRTAGHGQTGKGWRWTGSALWKPHDLRHVAACWMLFDLDLDPAVVAAKLGHADPSFTVKRYVGVRGDPDNAAMDVTDRW